MTQTHQAKDRGAREKVVQIRRNVLTVDCFVSGEGKLRQKKERVDGRELCAAAKLWQTVRRVNLEQQRQPRLCPPFRLGAE